MHLKHLMFSKKDFQEFKLEAKWKQVITSVIKGFPGSSAGKDSICNEGDPSWVGKAPWRRDRLPTPVFLASLVTQTVKNPPTIQETWV